MATVASNVTKSHLLSTSSAASFPLPPSFPARGTRPPLDAGPSYSPIRSSATKADHSSDVTDSESVNRGTTDGTVEGNYRLQLFSKNVNFRREFEPARRSRRNIVTARKKLGDQTSSSHLSFLTPGRSATMDSTNTSFQPIANQRDTTASNNLNTTSQSLPSHAHVTSSNNLNSAISSTSLETDITARNKGNKGTEEHRPVSATKGSGNEDIPLIPTGIFLTAVNFEDSPRQIQLSANPPNQDCQPLMTTIGSITTVDSSPTTTLITRSTAGLQRVYLEGLTYMNSHVSNVEREVDRINRRFHRTKDDTDDWLSYLRECNGQLLQANVDLVKSGFSLQVIDSDSRLVQLLNNLRASNTADQTTIDSLTIFWQSITTASHDLEAVLERFRNTVLNRISHNYKSGLTADLQVPICQQYARDIQQLLTDLEAQLANTSLLLKNFSSNQLETYSSRTPLTDQLMLSCDLKAFPLLGLVGEICGRIGRMCDTARMLLSRDEEFMHQVNAFIRETRAATRIREQVLSTEKQRQNKGKQNLQTAGRIVLGNRQKLRLIELELQELELMLDRAREELKSCQTQMSHKESMVDFLKVTLSQTKRNCRLQTKRSKLLTQVKELAAHLKSMETELEIVQDQILAKSHEKLLVAQKISSSQTSYGALKSDLDKFSEEMEEMEAEVSGLSGQLLQLEIVCTIRTAPEILDNLSDRPTSVKLSKSLRKKIKERQAKSLTLNTS